MRQRIFAAHNRRRAVAWAALGFGLMAAMLARPAAAEPGDPAVPDAGSRPVASGAVQLPGTAPGAAPAQNVPAGLGPLARQIMAADEAVQTLAEQLKQVEADVGRLAEDAAGKQAAWEAANEDLEQARGRAESAAAEAYKAAVAMGPFGKHAQDLHKLSKYSPLIGARPGSESPARELARAEAAEKATGTVHRAAQQALRSTTTRRDTIRLSYQQRVTELATLRTSNAGQLALAEAQENAYNAQMLAGKIPTSAVVDGMTFDPRVQRVLQYAFSKLGKPYVWGDEGPNSYDCSGLVWDSYRQVGVGLPRIANSQFNGTRQVALSKLLPGDLVFYGPPGSWVGIYHVVMYIGDGKVIQAPTSGDVVKISVMRYTRIYGATRPLPAVSAPLPGPGASSSTSNPGGGGTSSSSSSSSSAPPSSSASASAEPSESDEPSDPPSNSEAPNSLPPEDPDPEASGS